MNNTQIRNIAIDLIDYINEVIEVEGIPDTPTNDNADIYGLIPLDKQEGIIKYLTQLIRGVKE